MVGVFQTVNLLPSSRISISFSRSRYESLDEKKKRKEKPSRLIYHLFRNRFLFHSFVCWIDVLCGERRISTAKKKSGKIGNRYAPYKQHYWCAKFRHYVCEAFQLIVYYRLRWFYGFMVLWNAWIKAQNLGIKKYWQHYIITAKNKNTCLWKGFHL